MTCVDQATWNKAKTDCANLQASVKGFGYVATGLAGLRGLGFSITGSVTPASFQAYVAGSAPLVSSAPSASSPSSSSNINNISTASANTAYDPCAIAAQPSCGPATCPTGYKRSCTLSRPGETGPTPCFCIAPKNLDGRAANANYPVATAPPASSSVVQQASATGGFNQWGLLAALAVGGFVVYKIATHKKAS